MPKIPTLFYLIGFTFIFQISPISTHAQFDKTINNLEEFNQKTITEQVFLHIDRDIYFPGDTLWFKAYVRNKASLYKKSFSNALFVQLANEEGDIIQKEKFLVNDSGAKGQLELGENLTEGNYYIIAWAGWMKNFGVEEVFRTRIQVKYLNKDSYRLVPNYSRKDYYPGDTVYMEIKCYNNLLREVENVGFMYRISTGDDIIVRGYANALNSFRNQVNFILPKNLKEPCKLNVYGSYRQVDLDREFDVPVHYDIYIDFYPEGGQALLNMMNRVAFKAVYPNGTSAEIEGVIVDGNGFYQSFIKTEHDGMGVFSFVPQKDEEYFLKITKPAGITKRYKIPYGKDKGLHLSAGTKEDKIYVSIQRNGLATDTCLLTLMIRGYLFYSKAVPVQNDASVVIPTDTLPVGIGVVTLFNKELLPLAERLVFVNYHKTKQVTLTTNSSKYLNREKVYLNISTNSNDHLQKGDYSLAVVDEKLGLSDSYNQSNIFSSFYFLPEIKGTVTNPEYYFSTGSQLEKFHLDLLLMTQGWRNYKYMEIAENIDSVSAPTNYNLVSGQLLKKRSIFNPVPVQGELVVYFAGISHKVQTDGEGKFSFLPVFEAGVNPNIFLSATSMKGKENIIIQFDSDTFADSLKIRLPILIEGFSENYNPQLHTLVTSKEMLEWIGPNHFLIEPVTVTARGRWKEQDIEKAVISNMSDEYKKVATLTEIEDNRNVYDIIYDMKLKNLRINSNDILEYFDWVGTIKVNPDPWANVSEKAFERTHWVPVTWYVNQYPYTDHPRTIYSKAIKELYFLTGEDAKMLFGSRAVCYIITDPTQHTSSLLAYNRSNTKILPRYTITKEFYQPKYDTPEKRSSPVSDLRTTIHWEPVVNLDSNSSGTVTFYNSDQITTVKCILQGISDDGIPVYGETEYEVTFQTE